MTDVVAFHPVKPVPGELEFECHRCGALVTRDAIERHRDWHQRFAFDWPEPGPGRVPPRECLRAARDALSRMYSRSDDPLPKLWMMMAEALDWQRRAFEQMAQGQPAPAEHSGGQS